MPSNSRRSGGRAAPPARRPRVQAETPSIMADDSKPIAAIDFYSALSRSLDALQRQLANANNTFADFVVKEFRLETPVALSVDALGAVSFTLPTADSKPETLTRLSMLLNPVAKAPDAVSVVNAEDQRVSDLTPIDESPYIPKDKLERLRGSSIATVGDFLGVAADVRFSAALESMLASTRKQIGEWVDRIRLASAGKLTRREMEILASVKINSLSEVAAMSDATRKRLTEEHPTEFPAAKVDALIALARPRLPVRPIDLGSLVLRPDLGPSVRPIDPGPPVGPPIRPIDPRVVVPPARPVRPVR
jgi:hypothetical protein